MAFESVNPYTGLTIATYEAWDEARIEATLAEAASAAPAWALTPLAERTAFLRRLASELRARRPALAALATVEMGKLRKEAEAEIEKCAVTCEYYAEHAEAFLADTPIDTEGARTVVAYQPLGTVLAVMPWNFPYWQVVRAAAPTLVAGNTMLLKHASNVSGCALAIEEAVRAAGAPEGVFRTLLIPGARAEKLIADRRIHAVTLTGSDATGRKVASAAGAALKKCVLELGGSDAFVVLDDAAIDFTVAHAVDGRFLNGGQSCIAAKRFIVVAPIADAFVAAFKAAVEALRPGDPAAESSTLAPMARADLRDDLHQQVTDSLAAGAVAVTGCRPLPGPGCFYAPSILDRVGPEARAYREELFGPVAIVIRANDEADALRIANDSHFGLGGSVWTQDVARGERVARALEVGSAFVNQIVRSDPRVPFGGVKDSGFGRELSWFGIREFVNAKALTVAEAGKASTKQPAARAE